MPVDSDSSKSQTLLRDVAEGDLSVFFEHQRDPVANRVAVFQARERAPFMAHWTKILGDSTVIKKTVLAGDEVAGYIVCFEQSGRRLVGYWLGRHLWGKGIATRALSEFLAQVEIRPLHALVSKDNVGSIRVLEKCGFSCSGEERGPTGEGGVAHEEFAFSLAR